ncbi:MAG: hypothetical protein ABIP97_11050 [Chthoniobacterales bacterium]
MPKKILVVAGDAGGGSAMAPVVKKLLSDPFWEVSIFAYRQSVALFSQQQIPHVALSDATTTQEIAMNLAEIQPDVLCLATSANGVDLEKLFLQQAKERNIPSLSIMDFWANYSIRYHLNGETILPNVISVIDEEMCKEMIACGFSDSILHICGHPILEETLASRGSVSPELHGALRVLFVSQPVFPDWNSPDFEKLYRGFSKKTVLPLLVESLEEISTHTGKEIELVIRTHPRETNEDFSWISSSKIKITVDSKAALSGFALIVGMDSMLLVETCMRGAVTVSLLPGITPETDVLPTNRWGLSLPIYEEAQIQPQLERALFDQNLRAELLQKQSQFSLPANAVARIIDLLRSLIPSPSLLNP